MINQAAKRILKALSFDGVEVDAFRHMADLKRLDPMKIFYKKIDEKIYNGSHAVPVRIFFPNEKSFQESNDKTSGLEDCYVVAKALYTGKFVLNVKPENITLIGDSAGGNLCAALSLMARDRGEFMPKRQILIYPATYNDYTEKSPFPSVKENGTDYLLTAGKMQDYIDLYAKNEEDKQNPYFAPYLAKDVSHQPDTLILTSEFDPLRDEGEAYGKRLKEAGNYVQIHRIKGALHGYFALGIKHLYVQESFTYINAFLKGEAL